VDHRGVLRDSRTGRPIEGVVGDGTLEGEEEEEVHLRVFFFGVFEVMWIDVFWCAAGYSFFDSGEVALLGRRKKSPFSDVGRLMFH
jgi:carnitine O-acetyltransferase